MSVWGKKKPNRLLALESTRLSFDLAFPADFLFAACHLSIISDPFFWFQIARNTRENSCSCGAGGSGGVCSRDQAIKAGGGDSGACGDGSHGGGDVRAAVITGGDGKAGRVCSGGSPSSCCCCCAGIGKV